LTWKVPFFDLQLGEAEKRAVMEALDSNWLTTGPQIARFEEDFAKAWGVPASQAIALTNCTAALHLALSALEIGPADEVICPSLTFVATANAIRYTGATPIFADIASEDDWCVDPDDIARKITPKTKALMVVHYAGHPCRMDEITALAETHNLKIVEDACHGPLVEWRGQKLGTIGDVGCFSFFSNKNMTTGEGGMAIVKSEAVAEKIRTMRSHGMTKTSYERSKGGAFGYDVSLLGYNYRMDEMRAALGIEQLKGLSLSNQRRLELIAYYRKKLAADIPDLDYPFKKRENSTACHIFPVLLPEGGKDRADIMKALAEKGVQTSIHYRPVHTFSAYEGFATPLPITDKIMERILTLPLYPSLSFDQIDHVTTSLKEAL
jgi:dTDP-4-amino-4,6-dideoxygalactose transaminase